jgi:hypothetical protein
MNQSQMSQSRISFVSFYERAPIGAEWLVVVLTLIAFIITAGLLVAPIRFEQYRDRSSKSTFDDQAHAK